MVAVAGVLAALYTADKWPFDSSRLNIDVYFDGWGPEPEAALYVLPEGDLPAFGGGTDWLAQAGAELVPSLPLRLRVEGRDVNRPFSITRVAAVPLEGETGMLMSNTFVFRRPAGVEEVSAFRLEVPPPGNATDAGANALDNPLTEGAGAATIEVADKESTTIELHPKASTPGGTRYELLVEGRSGPGQEPTRLDVEGPDDGLVVYGVDTNAANFTAYELVGGCLLKTRLSKEDDNGTTFGLPGGIVGVEAVIKLDEPVPHLDPGEQANGAMLDSAQLRAATSGCMESLLAQRNGPATGQPTMTTMPTTTAATLPQADPLLAPARPSSPVAASSCESLVQLTLHGCEIVEGPAGRWAWLIESPGPPSQTAARFAERTRLRVFHEIASGRWSLAHETTEPTIVGVKAYRAPAQDPQVVLFLITLEGSGGFQEVDVVDRASGVQLAAGFAKASLQEVDGQLIATQLLRNPGDPNCCPTGGEEQFRIERQDGRWSAVPI